jgi:hypothetical protein
MMVPEDPGMHTSLRHEVVVREPGMILPSDNGAAQQYRQQQQYPICLSAFHLEQNCKFSHFIFEMRIFAV